MNTPKSTVDLTSEVEKVVARYLVELRRAVAEAVERALGSVPLRSSETQPAAPKRARGSSVRRSSAEIGQLGERLYELVRARPGGAMAEFAAELDVPVRGLQRPMSTLLRSGRVRSVGQRTQTRYFPLVTGKR
jgi:hypothetical protein